MKGEETNLCQWGILIAKILNVKLIHMKSQPDNLSSNWPVDMMRNVS